LSPFSLLFSCEHGILDSVMDMTIHKSAEDYLEAMLMLKEERGYIRSIDVADKLGVTKPSVSYATKRLRENGYISMDPAGMIVLLEPGLEIAERIYERHKLLTEILVYLGVSPETAREDACKVEHDLSVETFDAIRDCAKKLF
jgi:Mn-dependent DtxR family transcriptional regulator